MATPANQVSEPLVVNKISSLRKERNVNHVWNDVKIGEHRGEKQKGEEVGKKDTVMEECSFWAEFSDVQNVTNVKELVLLSELDEDLFIFQAIFHIVIYFKKATFIVANVY